MWQMLRENNGQRNKQTLQIDLWYDENYVMKRLSWPLPRWESIEASSGNKILAVGSKISISVTMAVEPIQIPNEPPDALDKGDKDKTADKDSTETTRDLS